MASLPWMLTFPTEVILAEMEQGRGILGVMDGVLPQGRRGRGQHRQAESVLGADRRQVVIGPGTSRRIESHLGLALSQRPRRNSKTAFVGASSGCPSSRLIVAWVLPSAGSNVASTPASRSLAASPS